MLLVLDLLLMYGKDWQEDYQTRELITTRNTLMIISVCNLRLVKCRLARHSDVTGTFSSFEETFRPVSSWWDGKVWENHETGRDMSSKPGTVPVKPRHLSGKPINEKLKKKKVDKHKLTSYNWWNKKQNWSIYMLLFCMKLFF